MPSKVEKTPDGTPVLGEQSLAGASATEAPEIAAPEQEPEQLPEPEASPEPETPAEPEPAPQSDADQFAGRVAPRLLKLLPKGATAEPASDGETPRLRVKLSEGNVRGANPALVGLATGVLLDTAADVAADDLRRYWGI